MKDYPFISTMIVTRNEEKYIKKSFESLLNQDYPNDKYEILIVDGLSDDSTLKVVNKTIEEYEQVPQIKILKNKKKILASGWNLGIKESLGKYVVRIDAHSYVKDNFLTKNIETMLRVGDAICVGGTLQTESLNQKGKVISYVLSSPFGVGNSKFRYTQKAGYVDTVAFGLYKKDIFKKVGYFDESLERNQDNDMHQRIKENGGKFYLNPEISAVYFSRDTVKGMIKQGYQNGRWCIITLKKDKKTMSVRHIIPLCFFSFITIMLLVGLAFKPAWWILGTIIGIYLILSIIFSVKKTKKITEVVKMPGLFFLLHFSYGLGSFRALFQ